MSPQFSLPREMTDEGDICQRCEAVLYRLIWPSIESRWEPDEASVSDVNVGFVAEIATTKQCSLCCFFIRLLGPRERLYCFIQGGNTRVTEAGMRKMWDLTVHYHDGTGEEGDRVQFRLCADSAHEVHNGEAVYDLARPVDPLQCRPAFLKEWYKECRDSHGDTCEMPKPMLRQATKRNFEALPQATGLRVIDVESSCISPAPPCCRYAALSYVWGSTKSLRLLNENFERLTQPNGLRTDELSKTITDAMSATAMIGERYLWVDALCIIQDNQDDGAAQLYQMDKVYRGAAVTIVAAVGFDSADGLPGLRPWSRSPEPLQSVHVRGLHLQSRWPDSETIVSGSKWWTRGWTYQELMMSKRLLVFTECQVFYSCETDCQAEDSVSEVVFDPEKIDSNDVRRSRGNKEPFSIGNDMVSYESAVYNFTHRDLSFQSDGLNAVSGVLSAIRQEHDEAFLCGLLVSTMLEHSILWHPMNNARRRDADHRRPFPSWSWVGWVGPITYNIGESFGPSGQNYTEVREISEWSAILPDGTEIFDVELISFENILAVEQCLLRFHAYTCCFRIGAQRHGTLTEISHNSENACYPILKGNIWIGSVVLNKALADSLLVEHKVNHHYEFVSLSRSPCCWSFWLPGVSDNDDTYQITNEDGEEIDHPFYDHHKLSSRYDDPGLYNVMMIERKDDVAYRLAIGQIHVDGWNMGNISEKEIKLG